MMHSVIADFLVIPEPDARFLTAIFMGEVYSCTDMNVLIFMKDERSSAGYFVAALYLALVARQSSLVQVH